MESIDSELIEMLERKAPEHLTIEEIERLSARLDKSPELQKFLIEQLQMEQYLAAALSRIDVRVDDIIAGRRRKVTPNGGRGRFGVAAALLVLILVGVAAGGVAWYRAGRGGAADGEQVANGEKAREEQASGGPTAAAPQYPPPVIAAAPDKGAARDTSSNQHSVNTTGQPATNSGSQSSAVADKQVALDGAVKQQGAGTAAQPRSAPRSPVDTKTAPPWESQLAAPPRPWASIVLAAPPSRGLALQGDEPVQWLAAAGPLSKLRAPWPADAMLRLRISTKSSCEVRLWKGNEGALFQLAGNAGWSSYHATRDPGQAEPKLRELWETDDGLYWKFHNVEIANFKKARGKIRFDRIVHTNDTPVDLFWHDGVVQLWRGDLRLASAPLPAPPDDVYLKMDGQLEHLSIDRIEKPPTQPRHEPVVAVDSAQPATLAWSRQAAAPATIENGPDGGLKLSTPEGAQPARASVALPVPGICDVIFKIQGATNGTGVYLGGPDGAPIAGVQLVETAAPGHNELSLTAPWEGAPAAPIAAAAPSPIWARLLVASGAVKCWQSRDGRHWAYIGAKPLPAGAPPISTYGIYAAAGTKPARTIMLKQIQVRDYSGLNSLAPPELLTKAPAVPSPNAQAWKQTAVQSLPGGVDRGAWHRAVALRTIASGAPQEVCSWLLRALLKDAGNLPRSVEQNRRLLAEFPDVAQMGWVSPADGRPQQPIMGDLVAAAGEFADAAQSEGETRPFTALGRQVIAARMGAFPELKYEFPDNLVLPELMQLAAAERYDEMEQTAHAAQLYGRDEVASAAQWALELAAKRRRGDTSAAAGLAGGRGGENQLSIDTTKAQRMFMDDLMGSVRSGQWPRASQLITHLEPAGRLEMFADPSDSMVWVTPAAQVAALMKEYPLLAAQMQRSFADRGRLRVRFAIADNDTAAVTHAATQFAGTSAAAEAYLWIGDQLLKGGDAVGAVAWYGKAQPSADVAQREQLAARLRLAHAKLGRDFGRAVSAPVRLGEREYTAQEFEAEVQAVRKQGQTAAPVALSQAPPPSGFRVEPLAAAPGDRPWLGEGLALAAAGETLLAQDARTVVAWDLAQNKPRWQRPLGDGGGGVTWLPQMDASGVVVTSRAGGAAQLQRLDLAKGEPQGKPATVAGACFNGFAPQVNGNTALALASRPINNKPTLVLSAVDLKTGETVRDMPLLPRGAGKHETCPPLVAADAVLVFVDGGIVCCETAGVIRWIRRQHATAAKAETARNHVPTRSLVIDGDAIVWQPRVPYIERIDLARGHRKWLRMLPEIRRIIGIVDGRLIVEANERLVALNCADGKVLWNKPLGELLAPVAVGSPGGILVTRAKTVRPADPAQPNSRPLLCPELVWLDPANGQMRGVWPLENLTGEHLALGPWTISNGTIITFFGAGKATDKGVQWDPARLLMRIIPQGGAQPPREEARASIWDGI